MYGYGNYGYLGLGTDVPYVKFGTTSGVGHPVADNSGKCGDAFAVEQMLKDLGYYGGAIDGIFGDGVFKGLRLFSQEHGVAYPAGTFPKADVCQALISAWEAQMAPPVPTAPPTSTAPAPGAPAPSTTGIKITPEMLKRIAAMRLIRIPSKTATPRMATLPTAGGIKGWWDARSSTEKLMVVGGGVLVVGGVMVLVMRRRATPNRRRRRRSRR